MCGCQRRALYRWSARRAVSRSLLGAAWGGGEHKTGRCLMVVTAAHHAPIASALYETALDQGGASAEDAAGARYRAATAAGRRAGLSRAHAHDECRWVPREGQKKRPAAAHGLSDLCAVVQGSVPSARLRAADGDQGAAAARVRRERGHAAPRALGHAARAERLGPGRDSIAAAAACAGGGGRRRPYQP
eukprot:scaffold115173_cov63-Phaeocystis_antarctica.AAC.1